jgi:hypothetical protein
MPAALLNKKTVERVIGQTRLRRLLRAGWLAPVLTPVGRNGSSSHRRNAVLFNPRDVHAALTRLERSVVPPDRIEIARVRASEALHGRAYVRKTADPPPPGPPLEEVEFELDFSSVDLF